MNEKLTLKTAVAIFAIGLAGGASGYGIIKAFEGDTEKPALSEIPESSNPHSHLTSQMPTYFASAAPTEFTSAAEKCIDGVVHVKTKYVQDNQVYGNPFYQYFFGMPDMQRQQQAQASGSGVIISNDGYIVTNNHVIENSTSIEVVLNDRRTYEAQLIGRDPSTDLALLKINADSLTTIQFGDSDNLKIGEWVVAIGNPFNLTSTVTAGIVSAKGRNINIIDKGGAIESFIQTDAAVNPGNSGGALVNTEGKLIGINTAIASQTGNFAGYAFAVPTSIVQKVISDLMEYGSVQRALIGVSIMDISAELAQDKGLSNLNGVYVGNVNKHSAGDDAGLESGDVITAINGKKTNSVAQLQEEVSRFRPGDKTQITYIRNGKTYTSEITFKNKDNSMELKGVKDIDILGASFEELNKSDLKKLGLKNGVQVTDLQSGKLMASGMRKGFIICLINNTPITSIADIEKCINGHKGGVYIEGIYPNGQAFYYAFGM